MRVGGRWALPAGGPLLEGSGERGGYDPADLQSAYDIPSTIGSTQTIALIEAYGYAAAATDLAAYRSRYGLGACTRDSADPAVGCFRKVNELGEEANYPRATDTHEAQEEAEWDVEAALDLEMASAACSQCRILLVEASSPSAANLAEATDTAAELGATEISNSYGIAEEKCPSANCEGFSADYDHPGVLITASAGDSGYDNAAAHEHSASFPAASPYVVAVGGTSLRRAANGRGFSEEVWAKSGAGCSRSEQKPTWQKDTGCGFRTSNDVAAVADIQTPVSVYASGAGGWINVGGTSVGAPLVAGIEAHASAYARSLPGAAAFYQDPGALYDVTVGGDGEYSGGECAPPAGGAAYLCNAAAGYDGPTGNGTPDGPLDLAEGPPTVTTSPATEVTGAGATLNGIVSPNNLATSYHFEYGTSVAYGTIVPVPEGAAGSGKLAEAVSESITGLAPDTTYHYRLVATNGDGTREGQDMSFTTAKPTVTGLDPGSGPSVGGTAVTISGTDLAGATKVMFGPTPAESFTVRSPTSISAVSPTGAGVVDVTVTTPAGTSATEPDDEYLYTEGPELNGSGELGASSFGGAIAVSADGNTALLGGSGDDGDEGAVWVFTRTAGVWSEQAKLVGDCTSDCGNEGAGEIDAGVFGGSVAISADGNTALVGAGWDDGGAGHVGQGAAWIFTRAAGVWSEQAKLVGDCVGSCEHEGTGAAGKAEFGRSVALSGDGDTALLGGPADNGGDGAVWIFTREGGAWSQQGEKLVGDCTSACANEGRGESDVGPGSFGESVALSADGDTALVGASSDDSFTGAVWAFTREDGAWSEQGAKLTPSNENGNSEFGGSLALSGDGNTALIGASSDGTVALPNFWAGAGWIYTREGGAWSEGAKLVGDCTGSCAGQGTAEIGEARFGSDVALSADGNSALIGASLDNERRGAAWLFTHSGSSWTSQGPKLTAAGQGSEETLSGRFGASVALSSDGRTALVGAPGLRREAGAAWVLSFPAIPTVASTQPSAGPAGGGTLIKIIGANLTEVTAVDFGATAATDVKVDSDTEMTATSPRGSGAVDVTVATPQRTSPASPADRFTYTPSRETEEPPPETKEQPPETKEQPPETKEQPPQETNEQPPPNTKEPLPPNGEEHPAQQTKAQKPRKAEGRGSGTVTASARATVAGARARLALRCAGRGPCKGTLELKAKIRRDGKTRTIVIAHARYALATGKMKRLSVKLDASALAMLRHERRLTASLSGKGVKRRTVTLSRRRVTSGMSARVVAGRASADELAYCWRDVFAEPANEVDGVVVGDADKQRGEAQVGGDASKLASPSVWGAFEAEDIDGPLDLRRIAACSSRGRVDRRLSLRHVLRSEVATAEAGQPAVCKAACEPEHPWPVRA